MFENYKISIFNRKGKLYIQFFVDGKMKQKSTRLEDTPANRKLIQKEVIPQLLLKLKSGEFNKKKVENFEWYAKRYLRNKETLKTYWELHNLITNQLYPIFKGKSIDIITRGEIKQWIDKRLEIITPKRMSRLLQVLSAIFKIAVEYEAIDKNPCDSITLPKHNPVRKMQPFTKEEVSIIIENAEGWFKNFVAFCFYTGMRHGEILALTWSDINFDEMYINVDKRIKKGKIDVPKTKSSIRKVPILKNLLPYLQNQYKLAVEEGSMVVFFNPRTKKRFYDTKNVLPIWYKLLDKIGFERRVMYNTRHTFATNMLRAGIPILDISQMLGHKTIEEVMRTYAKYLPEEHLKISRKIDPFTDNPTDNKGQNPKIGNLL